jgi:hypothetical protein
MLSLYEEMPRVMEKRSYYTAFATIVSTRERQVQAAKRKNTRRGRTSLTKKEMDAEVCAASSS